MTLSNPNILSWRRLGHHLAQRLLLFLGVLVCLQGAVWAQAPREVHPIGDRSWVTPDLDGDAHPEAAQGISLGWDHHGYAYSLNFHLSGDERESTIQVHTQDPFAIHVMFRDVDGDQDLDLVITGGLHHEPVGIWLNEGGEFTPAPRGALAELNWSSETSLETREVPPIGHLVAIPGRTMAVAAQSPLLSPIVWPKALVSSNGPLAVGKSYLRRAGPPRAPPVLLPASV